MQILRFLRGQDKEVNGAFDLRMDAPDPYRLAELLVRMLCAGDVYRLSLVDRAWRDALGKEECWAALFQRDFARERSGERLVVIPFGQRVFSTKKQAYIHAYRTSLNWKMGRSLPAISPSKRAHRFMIINDHNIVAEVGTRDGTVRVWRQTSGGNAIGSLEEVLDIASMSPSADDDFRTAGRHRVIIDAVLGPECDPSAGLSLVCGGLDGAWIQSFSAEETSAITELSGSKDRIVRHIARQGQAVAASTSELGVDLFVWDANRPDTALITLPSVGTSELKGMHLINENLAVMAFSSGTIVDVDFREPASCPRTYSLSLVSSKSPLKASGASITRRVFATQYSCAAYDSRMFSSGNYDTIVENALMTWRTRDVSSLAIVNDSTIVAGMSTGWEGPISVLNADGSMRRLLYSSERNYRVLRLAANSSSLGATCTDWNRLFIFNPIS